MDSYGYAKGLMAYQSKNCKKDERYYCDCCGGCHCSICNEDYPN
jgi:hypothetical protein